MSNMEYCRFENTYNALQDCYEAIANDTEKLSTSEGKYKQKLVQLCKDVALDFSEITGEELG